MSTSTVPLFYRPRPHVNPKKLVSESLNNKNKQTNVHSKCTFQRQLFPNEPPCFQTLVTIYIHRPTIKQPITYT